MNAEIGYTTAKNADGNINDYPVVLSTNENYEKFVCAKMVFQREPRYFIKSYSGRLINPNSQTEIRDRSFNTWKWHQVQAPVFKLYLEYLKTGIERHLIQAERGMM